MNYIVTTSEVQAAYERMMKSTSPVRPVLTTEKSQIDVLVESILPRSTLDDNHGVSELLTQIENVERIQFPDDFRAYLLVAERVEQAEPKINILLSFSAVREIDVFVPTDNSAYKFAEFANWFLYSKSVALGFLGGKRVGVFTTSSDGDVLRIASTFSEFVNWLRITDLDSVM